MRSNVASALSGSFFGVCVARDLLVRRERVARELQRLVGRGELQLDVDPARVELEDLLVDRHGLEEEPLLAVGLRDLEIRVARVADRAALRVEIADLEERSYVASDRLARASGTPRSPCRTGPWPGTSVRLRGLCFGRGSRVQPSPFEGFRDLRDGKRSPWSGRYGRYRPKHTRSPDPHGTTAPGIGDADLGGVVRGACGSGVGATTRAPRSALHDRAGVDRGAASRRGGPTSRVRHRSQRAMRSRNRVESLPRLEVAGGPGCAGGAGCSCGCRRR